MSRRTSLVLLAASLPVVALGLAGPASAAPKAASYRNCTALNAVYPHGVGRTGAKDHVSGKTKPVTNFKVSTTVYNLNNGPHKAGGKEYDLDRDNDGVACEKH
jgi:Excalibur calcium-binding domain